MADTIGTSVIRILDANGDPVPGAKAYFYDSGTTTPRIVYQDVAAAVPHASPVVADSSGILPPIYATVAVKMTVTTSTGASVPGYPVDPAAKIASTGSAASAVSFSPTIPIPVTNAQAAIEMVQSNLDGASSAYIKTLLDDIDASTAQTTLGVSTFAKTLIDDVDSVAARNTLIVPYRPNNSGLGQWSTTSATVGQPLALPAGGTWAFFLILTNGGVVSGYAGGIAAGGATIYGGSASIIPTALVWRYI